VIRVAAVGDVHVGRDSRGRLAPAFETVDDHADLLLLAGDLTQVGTEDEAAILADELRGVSVPIVAVLGNHDLHSDQTERVVSAIEAAGVQVLEGEAATFKFDGSTVGIAGAKGFGGGFAGACASDFGEPEMKEFIRHTLERADRVEEALDDVGDADVRIALLHYAPVKDTLLGEKLEIYPFLGSYLLGEAVDRAGADLVVHGHAHHGTEKGLTPGGIRVRNVAHPVIGRPYNVYCLGPEEECAVGERVPAGSVEPAVE